MKYYEVVFFSFLYFVDQQYMVKTENIQSIFVKVCFGESSKLNKKKVEVRKEAQHMKFMQLILNPSCSIDVNL